MFMYISTYMLFTYEWYNMTKCLFLWSLNRHVWFWLFCKITTKTNQISCYFPVDFSRRRNTITPPSLHWDRGPWRMEVCGECSAYWTSSSAPSSRKHNRGVQPARDDDDALLTSSITVWTKQTARWLAVIFHLFRAWILSGCWGLQEI